jgi:hypothetical protein
VSDVGSVHSEFKVLRCMVPARNYCTVACVTPNNPPIRGFPSTLDVKVWISIFVKAGLL